ncbi:hypothetical protein ACROYT_G032758 [Oculina patagonica]
MWTAKLLAVTLLLLIFVRDTESRWGQRVRRNYPPPCSPRACQVSYWSTWSPCTRRCGTSGTKTRTRTKTVVEACGGSCPYHLSEIRSCNTDKCQNSGTPTYYGCFCPPGYNGLCCEIATSTLETRPSSAKNISPTPTTLVTSQPPFIKSSPTPCSSRACQVSYWSTWSPCTHQCGTSGTQTRTRTKTVLEACGGSCPYHLSEIRSCNTDKCQNSGTPTSNGCSCPPGYNGTCCEIVPHPVDGQWSEWSVWTLCPPNTCGFATRNRTRSCTNPAPAFGGQKCHGTSAMSQLCPENCPILLRRAVLVLVKSATGQHGVHALINVAQVERKQEREQKLCSRLVVDHVRTIYQRFARVTQTNVRIQELLQATVALARLDITERVVKLYRIRLMVVGQNGQFGPYALRTRVDLLPGTAPELVQILRLRLVARNAAEPQLCHSVVPKTVRLLRCWSMGGMVCLGSCPPCAIAVRNRSRSCTNPKPAFGGQKCRGASAMFKLCPKNCPTTSPLEPRPCTSMITSNSKFTASSSSEGPGTPVLYGSDVWCAGVINANQYLKVDLGAVVWINQVSVQGKPNSTRSVTQYYIQTSTDNINFAFIFDGSRRKAFFGPFFNGNAVVTTNFTLPVQARYVLFSPTEPLIVLENHLCMRVDIASCQNVTAPSTLKPSSSSSLSVNTMLMSTIPVTTPTPFIVLLVFVRETESWWGKRRRQSSSPHPICKPRACQVSYWSTWSPCSHQCGTSGKQTRTRTKTVLEACGGSCPYHLSEVCSCNRDKCQNSGTPISKGCSCAPGYRGKCCEIAEIVHGGWSQWTYFPCNVPCGAGKRNRTRTCTNPPPSGGGAACPGAALETLDCYNGPCQDPNIPLIDLVFALSATSANSVRSYELMQNTLKAFINKYGVNKIHYSIIVYGDSVIRVVSFNRTFPISASDLKAAIYRQPALFGGPVLKDALQEAFRIFNETVGRPGARKVLVVITDKNSGAPSNALANAVRPLEDNWVLVISVGVGYVERSELNVISPNPLDVISARLKINPSVLAERIMDRILRRNIPDIDIGFAISSASIDSDSIFALMKRIINTIIDRYGMLKIRFSVIVYGSIITTRFTFDNTIMFTQEELLRAVNETQRAPGMPDLQMALTEAKRLFQLTSRPNATKVLVLFSDVVGPTNDSALAECADNLRKEGVLILSVGFGAQVNQIGYQMKKVVISPSDYMAVRNITTQRPVVIAETIMFKVLQVPRPTLFPTSATVDPTSSGLLTIQPEVQRVLVDLLRSFSQVIQRLEVLLGGSLSPTDLETFRNETLQILRQIEDQLVIPSPTQPNNMRMVKRAIPEFPDPQELKQMLENIQRRLLG